MLAILCAVVSIFAFRFRGRASLEIELIALRHQVTVLRRQRPGRLHLSSLDRLLWVWLYRIWPQVIDAMVLVKPATVVQWHRNGLRFYWRWRSRRPGRPKIGTEIRDLIRRMSRANPLWGAPRIQVEHDGLFLYYPRRASLAPKLRAFIDVAKKTLKSFE